MLRRILIGLLILLSPSIINAQVSGVGQLGCSGTPISGTGWTSGTANNSTQPLLTNTSAIALLIQLTQTSTITGGAITFQYAPDGSTFISIPVTQVLNPDTGVQLSNPYTLVASTNQQFLLLLNGKTNVQLKLTSAILGSATVTPFTTSLCTLPLNAYFTQPISAASLPLPTGAALDSSLSTIDTDLKSNIVLKAGANIIGKVGIDQTTPGTTNLVQESNFPATVDTNSGVKSSNTPRIVFATDQPSNTNPFLVNQPTGPNLEVAPVPTATTTNTGLEGVILSAASTNATSVKGSAGNMYGYEIYNTTTTIYYLRLYNLATAPTCSSATGFIRSIPIIPGTASSSGGQASNFAIPIAYTTGIAYCLTGGSSSTDNTNAAVGVFGAIRYK